MSETLEQRAARILQAHTIPRDRPPPLLRCVIRDCGQTEGARPFLRGPLCLDHQPALPGHRPSPVPSPSDTMPARTYGTATTDPRPGRDG